MSDHRNELLSLWHVFPKINLITIRSNVVENFSGVGFDYGIQLVLDTMQSNTVRYAIIFFNFSSILNIKLENGAIKISKQVTLWNILKILIILLTNYIFGTLFRVSIFEPHLLQFDKYSVFTLFCFGILAGMMNFIIFNLIAFQYFRRFKLKELTNFAFNLPLNDNKLNCLRSRCINEFVRSGTLFFITSAIQVSVINLSMLSFIAYAFLMFPYIIVFAFVCFVKFFELLFVILLEDFQSDIEELKCSTQIYSNRKLSHLASKYSVIFEASQKFHESLSAQVTLMIYSFASILTLQVNYWPNLIFL